ncbi:MAG: LysM peptidoglycan-binding domain-containing M23 family metallopeptidase [Pseudomonadota bacterium]
MARAQALRRIALARWQQASLRNCLLALCPALILSGCIPQAAGDYGRPTTTAPTPAPRLESDPSVGTVADTRPLWEARPVSRNAVSVSGGSYIVQPGDTLRGIGNKTGAGSEALAAINGLEPPFTIYAGQRLTIPSGLFHNVSSGETGIAIARAYNVRWADIVVLNDLEEPFILRIGQRLKLPDGAMMQPASPPENISLEQRAAAFSLDIDDIVTGGQPAAREGVAVSAGNAAPARASTAAIVAPSGFDGRFQWPASGAVLSRFGNKGGGKVNDGIELAMQQDARFSAAAGGVVAYTGDDVPTLGNLILIDHGSGWVTAYGNASRILVKRGQQVKAGDVLGLAGDTGLATRPQLHFELRRDRKPVDPLTRLPER